MTDHVKAGARVDRGSGALCPECMSGQVRPSFSSYPKDQERMGGRPASFWRCTQCGGRFLGPPVLEKKRRRHRSRPGDFFGPNVSHMVRHWAFPLAVILVTIIAVAFVLDRRNRDIRPRIVIPGRQP